jgi:hypothetical protein
MLYGSLKRTYADNHSDTPSEVSELLAKRRSNERDIFVRAGTDLPGANFFEECRILRDDRGKVRVSKALRQGV